MLWDLRQDYAVDTDDIDAIVLAASARVDDNPTFHEYRDAMLAENSSNYGGLYTCQIKRAFADRGIGSTPFEVTVSGDGLLNAGEMGHWSTYHECAPGGLITYEWAYREGPFEPWTIIMGANGSALDHSFCTDVTLRVNATSGGETASDTYSVYVSGSCPNAMTSDEGGQSRETQEPARPDTLRIGEMAPNPARSQARLSVALPQAKEVRVVLYNTVGQVVGRRSRTPSAGWHDVPVEVSGLSSGMYFARITVGDVTTTRRIVVVR